ncbi:hypothetical protein H0H93_011548 [Arthromyces matolae]|nr:hypothetical protein H0H93_011548 [Arthromyces matolae]
MSKFSPTPAELALVTQIFKAVDSQKLGILTGDVAVNVFSGAKLSPVVLGEIWNIADEDNNGWLPRKGVAIALRLIGWAQKGESITPELLLKPGPLADIEGYSALSRQETGTPLNKSPAPSLPILTPQERAKFLNIFNKAGPDSTGLLNGAKARDIFIKSKLSNDTLLQIWNLADTQDRGALDAVDFAIGMYFIQALMSSQLTFVPTTLPPGLYQQAAGNLASAQGAVRSHMTGTSGSFSPLSGVFSQSRSTIQPQHTGQSQLLQPNHTGLPAPSNPPALPSRPVVPSNPTSPPSVHLHNGLAQWDVTPEDKASADRFFDDLDTSRRGYIEGDVAVPFLLKSNLLGEDLAHIWDLADIHNDGKLTRDGFAIAMHLIQKKLAGADIPTTLPSSLVPPSLRVAATSSPFVATSHHQVPGDSVRDLLWEDTPPASAVDPPALRATEALVPVQTQSVTGSSPPAEVGSSSVLTALPRSRDLLSDDDDTVGHTSPPLHARSAEIGNTQNQLNSTNRALETLKSERAQLNDRLTSQNSQLESLQLQLSNAKTAYEAETKILASIRERYSTQTADIQKLQEELIRAESDLSAVRLEKADVEGAFLRDKEETRELQRKMAESTQLIERTKTEIEKAKKEAKQQKGLLAIAKKQLSSKEAERARSETEREEAAAQVAAITKERTEADSELATLETAPNLTRVDSVTFAAEHPLPSSPHPASPAPSIVKSNNPFDKFQNADNTSRSQSQFSPFTSSLSTHSTVLPLQETNALLNQGSLYDPFGFPVDSTTEDTSANGAAVAEGPSRVASPSSTSKPAPVDVSTLEVPPSIFSPASEGENDNFVTPPTSANVSSSPAVDSDIEVSKKFPALDDVTSKFPVLNTPKSASPPRVEEETHLGSKLTELDVEESDSDSDDEVPLADLAKSKLSPNQSSTISGNFDLETSRTQSFDDVFGLKPLPGEQRITDFPASTAISSSTVAAETLPSAGVSAFDEAMGVMPSSATPNKKAFTFDTAFDDNFDFNVTNESFSAPSMAIDVAGSDQKAESGGNSAPVNLAKEPKTSIPTSFSGPLPSTTNGHTMEGSSSAPKATFDEAFSGFDSGPSLTLDDSFDLATRSAGPDVTLAGPKPSVAPSSPPATSTSPPQARPLSPPPGALTRSPPPRTSSPKLPRPSTSSSKETHEKVKEVPARHSKLSIRLPFGKKKKQQQTEPLPASPVQHISISQDEPARTLSPAIGDDVEAVKQLSAMGFSRTEAIAALEKYDYDVQRALNNLLGSS